MCGLVGIVGANAHTLDNELERMRDRLTHRGPDDAGSWLENGVALGHRRLSIVDLSMAGHQPMMSRNERFVMAYNGEVYNAADVAAHITNFAPRGTSDTEVLLESIAEFGVARTLERAVGMFALAVFDRKDRKLWLARDRLGIKPLYYGNVDGRLVFASELSAMHVVFGNSLRLDRDALAAYLRLRFIPGSASIYEGVQKLRPGCIAEFSVDATGHAQGPNIARFWQLHANKVATFRGDCQEAVDEFERLALDAVACRTRADVPVGAFLSGGIDSTYVCALMQQHLGTPIKTFTMGFDSAAHDEAPHAEAVAQHLGTEHHARYVSERDLLGVVDRVPSVLDEPFADSSLLPTLLVCGIAREHVIVALSGDGGDELFSGYRRYRLLDRLKRLRRPWPGPVRAVVARALRSDLAARLAPHAPARFSTPGRPLTERLDNLAVLIGAGSDMDLYQLLMSLWKHPERLVPGSHEAPSVYSNAVHRPPKVPDWRKASWLDVHGYLPDDILTKVDRASMAVSLEARVPLLDHRLAEFCMTLPESLVRDDRNDKLLLRRAVFRHVPRELLERPKQGFGVPIDAWLRGPLRDWCVDLLSESSLARSGLFDPAEIIACRDAHLSGRADWGAYLWDVLVFQAWLPGGTRAGG